MRRTLMAGAPGLIAIVVASALIGAQGRVASPEGTASTDIRGNWIEITSGRPIKRGRDLWGSGGNYGKELSSGSPVWRAGANVSTRLKTDLPLVINGKIVPAGEYTVFIDLKPANWTLIISRWAAKKDAEVSDPNALWGSSGYTPDKDVVRAPMTLDVLPHSVDQLTWTFLDVTEAGGMLAIEWDKTRASVQFKVAP